jgi:membrane fusion protein, multidrug efflux system
VYIPLSAIYQTSDAPDVWVINNGVVNLKPVKIGAFADGKVQVLDGLQEGEVIVTAGVHKLREGQKVRATGDVQ